MNRRNWLLAAAIFLSGANLLGLLFPFSLLVFAGFILLSIMRPVRLGQMQLLAAACVGVAAVFGFFFITEIADLSANMRQMAVVVVALLLVGMLRADTEDVLEKYFKIFTFCAAVGLVFYVAAPDTHFLTYSIGPRSYLIGPSSALLDSDVLAFAAIGPYRFQGLFEEPGTFSVFSAAAAFWAFQRKRRWAFAILILATVLSEGVVGLLILVALFSWRWLSGVSVGRRLMLIALALICFTVIQVIDVEALNDTFQVADLLENKTLSGQARAEQLNSVLGNWQHLIPPSGFSPSEVLKVNAESITTGYVRGLIPFGLFLWAVLVVILFVGLRRMDLRLPSGILFLALLVAGTSRIVMFDLFIGWFVLFCVLRAQERGFGASALRLQGRGSARPGSDRVLNRSASSSSVSAISRSSIEPGTRMASG